MYKTHAHCLDLEGNCNMSELDESLLKDLEELSCIECSEEEQKKLLVDLNHILDYVKQLEKINTENVHTFSGFHGEMGKEANNVMRNVMREDVVGETMPQKTLLSNAPEHCDGLIKVPPTVKKGV